MWYILSNTQIRSGSSQVLHLDWSQQCLSLGSIEKRQRTLYRRVLDRGRCFNQEFLSWNSYTSRSFLLAFYLFYSLCFTRIFCFPCNVFSIPGFCIRWIQKIEFPLSVHSIPTICQHCNLLALLYFRHQMTAITIISLFRKNQLDLM